MIRSAALLLLAGILLTGCSQEAGSTQSARSTQPFLTFLSSTGRVGSASAGVPRRAAAPPVYAAATHAEHSAHNAEQGSPALTGSVAGSGGEQPESFEVELTPTGACTGAPPLRVVFTGGDGSFELWPAPGEYLLTVISGRSMSRAVRVRVTPEAHPEPLHVVLDRS